MFKDELQNLRLELGMSQSEIAKKLGFGVSTWEFWEMGRPVRPAALEKLIIEKLKSMIKKQKQFRSGFMLLNEVSDKEVTFSRKEAFVLAKAAIVFQINYYKCNPEADYIIYDIEDLEMRLKLLDIRKFERRKYTLAQIADEIAGLMVTFI